MIDEQASLLPEIIISESLKELGSTVRERELRISVILQHSFNHSPSSKATIRKILPYLNLTETGGNNDKVQSSFILTK